MTSRDLFLRVPPVRILVVEDEEPVRSGLVCSLTALGHQVEEASTGEQALEMLHRATYDLMLLDIRMPGIDGVEVMRRAHQAWPGLKIIILTGYASLESAVAAVRYHAADYLLKPASIRDLSAAIARALRWEPEWRPDQETPSKSILRVGPVTLNLEARLVAVEKEEKASKEVRLSATETAILAYLMRRSPVTCSCRELAHQALGYEVSETESRGLIRPHICRLRRKIEPDPSRPRLICTVVGKGYRFCADER